MGKLALRWKGDIAHGLATPMGIKCLEDVQLWSTEKNVSIFGPQVDAVRSIDYVNPQKVPLWNVSTANSYEVFSTSSETLQFFDQLLKSSDYDQAREENQALANLGLLIEVAHCNSKRHLFMIYFDARKSLGSPKLFAILIVKGTDYEESLLATKAEPDAPAEYIEINYLEARQKEKKLSRLMERTRSATPVSRTSTAATDSIYRRPSIAKAVSSTQSNHSTTPPIQHTESAQETRNKTMITQIIMGELRLRGIRRSNNEDDFKLLYNHMYKTTVFSFRRAIDSPLQLEIIRDRVDKLLNILE